MTKIFTCILCPNGCEITAACEGKTLALCEGNRCPKGRDYVLQELVAPMRNIATSVAVAGGVLPLCSVRLTGSIPKARIFDAVHAIHAIRLTAPVTRGAVLWPNLLDLGIDVIATRTVSIKEEI